MSAKARIRLKRAYDPPEEADGRRILVERLWPRGVTKEAAELDSNAPGLEELREAMGKGTVTFVFAAKAPVRNSATLLREYLLEGGAGG